MTFNDFNQEDKIKNKAKSNRKTYQVISSIGLDKVDIYLRDEPF